MNQTKPVLKPQKLSWTIINFWLDAMLLVNFVVLQWISAILQFVFPAGVDASGWKLWGADVVDWQNYQFVTLCVLSVGILVHVSLHWSWICGVINQKLFQRTIIKTNGIDTLIGVGVVAAILHLLGIGILLAQWMIQKSP